MEKKIQAENFVIDNSNKAFFADNVSVLHNENQFIIDFKQTTPRIDVVSGDQKLSFVTMHNSIVISPTMAKSFMDVIKDSIERYEKEFSKIKIPKQKKLKKTKTEIDGTNNNYIG